MDSVFPKPYDDDIQDVTEGMTIVIDGDTAPKAISSGQYLFIKNHSTLATGGYHATAAIGSGDAVSSSNVAADADGIVNAAYSALNGNLGSPSSASVVTGADAFSKIATLNSKTTKLESAISKIAWGGTITSPTIAVYGGTATQINSFLVASYNDEYIFVKGSVRLVNFVRTATNPGVKITLPVATSKSLVMEGLINMNNPSEVMRAQISANENYLYLFTSESITNQPNGNFIIVVPLLIIQR